MNADLLLEALRRMLLIRKAEQALAEDFIKNKIFSFIHFAIGQEAVAVGTSLALKPEDRMFGNHRSHSHYLSKGGNLYRMMAEIYGKADGCGKGFSGSMHMLDRSVHFMGSTPILGSVAPIATGSAFEQKASGSKNITVCFIGDGASEEGVVYESVNLAAVMRLPVMFIIENNLYAVSSDVSVRRARDYSARSVYAGLGANYSCINGNSFIHMFGAVQSARSHMLEYHTPAVIEAKVFRHMSHSGPMMDDAAGYRKIDTAEVRAENDCIKNLIEQIRGKGVSDETIYRLESEINLEVNETLLKAKAAPEPEASRMMDNVYA